jgi:hypothetical protein
LLAEPKGLRKISIGGLGILLGVTALIILLTPGGSPPLKTSCTKPAIAIFPKTVEAREPVQWSATGPAGTTFVLRAGGRRVSGRAKLSSSCTASGAFGVHLPAGHYRLTMVRTHGAAKPLAQHKLTVTPHTRFLHGIPGAGESG